jgi:broad specificity phosphatase PhoE
MKIVLLRHGKPDIPHSGRLRPCEMRKWIESYNCAALDRSLVPSREAVKEAQRCSAVVCSDLPRSVESAKILGVSAVHWSDPNFREADLPCSNWRLPALPPKIWAELFRAVWFMGYPAGGESLKAARSRAVVCAQLLMAIAEEHSSVLFVGHGFINRFIAGELLTNNWQGPAKPGRGYWSYSVYKFDENIAQTPKTPGH